MNVGRDLATAFRIPDPPKIKTRTKALIEELNFHLAELKQHKKQEHIVELVATISGTERRVRRLYEVDGNLLSFEIYDGLGVARTIAPVEQVSFTLRLLSSDSPEARPCLELNACSRPSTTK